MSRRASSGRSDVRRRSGISPSSDGRDRETFCEFLHRRPRRSPLSLTSCVPANSPRRLQRTAGRQNKLLTVLCSAANGRSGAGRHKISSALPKHKMILDFKREMSMTCEGENRAKLAPLVVRAADRAPDQVRFASQTRTSNPDYLNDLQRIQTLCVDQVGRRDSSVGGTVLKTN